jgi:integrase
MANIRQRGETYLIEVYVGKDSKGKKLRKSTTFTPTEKTPAKIRKEVERFAEEYERRIKEGKYFEGEDITFRQVFEIWGEKWAPQHLSIRCEEEYKRKIEKRFMKVLGHKKISRITPFEIQSIVDHMSQEEKLSPKTVKDHFIAFNSVMRYAFKMSIIQENPCLRCELPRIKRDNKLKYFTKDQALTFLRSLDNEYEATFKAHTRTLKKTGETYSVPEYTETYRVSSMWKAYFYLSIYGGFRRGELCALKWKDIDEESKTLSIKRSISKTTHHGQFEKTPKTVAGNRTITLPAKCFDMLREWKTDQTKLCLKLGSQWKGHRGKEFSENYVFINIMNGLAVDVDTPTHKFRELIAWYNNSVKTEEEKLPEIRLHDLRHTSATLLLSEGIDIETVSKRMGHEKASTTLDIYGHALETMDIKASETLEKLLG